MVKEEIDGGSSCEQSQTGFQTTTSKFLKSKAINGQIVSPYQMQKKLRLYRDDSFNKAYLTDFLAKDESILKI